MLSALQGPGSEDQERSEVAHCPLLKQEPSQAGKGAGERSAAIGWKEVSRWPPPTS